MVNKTDGAAGGQCSDDRSTGCAGPVDHGDHGSLRHSGTRKNVIEERTVSRRSYARKPEKSLVLSRAKIDTATVTRQHSVASIVEDLDGRIGDSIHQRSPPVFRLELYHFFRSAPLE